MYNEKCVYIAKNLARKKKVHIRFVIVIGGFTQITVQEVLYMYVQKWSLKATTSEHFIDHLHSYKQQNHV